MKKRGRKRKNERPSLGNLQDTAPELQQDDDANPSPSPTAIVDGGSPVGPLRRSTRRSSSVFARDYDEDYEGEGSGGRRRKEKRLQLVLGSPLDAEEDLLGIDWEDQGQWAAAGSEFEGEDNARNGDCSGGGNGSEKREPNSFRDAGNLFQGEPSDSGRRTPLPDKKLLVLTLDRLQKKDKYKVYSEPVDPDELPDYHEIIENPMDFSTIRNKLSAEAYTCLEEFEKDVFLITSNAMTYNAPSTIYYRQARSIEELAKKCFENIRQGGTDDDLEHKLVRRGRPPGKSSNKKHTGRPPTKHMLDFSDSVPGNTSHSYLWSIPSNAPMENGLALDTPIGASTCFQNLHYSDNTSWLGSHSALRNKQHSAVQGNRLAACESDKNIHELSTSHLLHGSHIVTALEGEKQLIPVGFHHQHAYARSLARFAAKLGPIGWRIAAKRIEKALPPGTKFGPGWIGEEEAPESNQHLIQSSSSAPNTSLKIVSWHETSEHCSKQDISGRPDFVKLDGTNPSLLIDANGQNAVCHNLPKPQVPNVPNGHHHEPYSFQYGKEVKEPALTRCWNLDVPMTHAQALEMVSRRSTGNFVHPASTNQ